MTTFVEIASKQRSKDGLRAAGDTVLTRREGRRTISVLSDGLGSGIKAGVLSSLTATMALRLIEREVPIERVARAIMATLPVCKIRRISYATFTIVDIAADGHTRVIEYDNPRYLFVRDGAVVDADRRELELDRPEGGTARLYYSELSTRLGDRIVFSSDGVTQAGMGTPAHPLGWGNEGVATAVRRAVAADPEISASGLAGRLVSEALGRDGRRARDDISSVVVYFRSPRRLLVASGPPLDPASDGELARRVGAFAGRRIVAGGTTGNIVARELGASCRVVMKDLDPGIPPYAEMEGADLVCEGILTMARVVELLEDPARRESSEHNAATIFYDHLMDSDSIDFVVGTRVNQAHQDPRVPARFELRRIITERLAALLSDRYLKEISISYL